MLGGFQSRMCVLSRFSCVWLFVTPWTVAPQAPQSLAFSRQEYQSGFPCFPRGYLPDLGMKPTSPTLQADFLLTDPPGKPLVLSGPRNCGPQTQYQMLGCGPTEAMVAQKQQLSTDLSTSSLFAVIPQRLIALDFSGWRVSGSSDQLVFPTSPLFPNFFHSCVRSNFYIKVFVLYTQSECTSLTEPSLIQLLVLEWFQGTEP